MAPQNNKREATPEQNDEVCKRLKEELKDNNPKSCEPSELKEDETVEKSNNNNNNSNNNNNNNISNNGNTTTTTTATITTTASGDQKNGEQEAATIVKNGEVNSETEAKVIDQVDKIEQQQQQQQSKTNPEAKSSANENKAQQSKSAAAEKIAEPESPSDDPEDGVLMICGGANWDMTGRKELPKAAKKPVTVNPGARNLWGPHRVTFNGETVRVRGVFSGCNACHSVIVTDEGITMTFGRNDKGQLGVGDLETKVTPVVVEALKGLDVIAAACGRSHTLFLTSDGIVFSCGDNKMGQCGTNQQAVQYISTPTRIAFKENKRIVKIACGAEFSMIVDADGRLYSFGHPEHGQLGHNSEGKYFTSGNKYAFHCEYQPRRIVTFIEKSREGHVSPVDDVQIVDVACGTNHTLAVDKRHRCFSWGFAGYHRLGHSETKNELVPRSIKMFDGPPSSGRGATRVFAGASHSMALDCNGLLYFWGQNKSSGEATMYPKNVQDLCGWRIKAVSCANRSIFVIAEDMCISWGPSPTYGELGYGEGKSKSSTVPQEVKTLEGVHVMNVACGFGHTLLISRDTSTEEKAKLEKFPAWP